MESEVSACSSCGEALPTGARSCDACGASQQAVGPAQRNGLLRPLLAVGAVALAALLGWFAYSVLTPKTPDLIAVQHLDDGGFADLYVVDDALDASDPDPQDRILRDVRIVGGGATYDGFETVDHGLFGFGHDGGTLFSYQEEGDDEWIVGLLDEGRVEALEEFTDLPSIVRTTSGTYLTSRSPEACTIMRLDGRTTERVARADACAVDGSADLALLADRGSSGIRLSIVELSSGIEVAIDEVDQGWDEARFSFSPDGRNLMVASTDPALPITLLVEVETGEVLVEEAVTGIGATVGGFMAYEFDQAIPTDTVVVHYSSDGQRDQVLTNSGGVQVMLNRSGTAAAFLEVEGDNQILSIATIESTGVGPIVELADLGRASVAHWTPGDRLLTIDHDGVIGVVDDEQLIEIGQLDTVGQSEQPQLLVVGPTAWLVSAGGRAGVVMEDPDPSFVPLDGLASVDVGTVSEDERWLVAFGRDDGSGQLVILFDITSREWEVVDEVDTGAVSDLTTYDGHAYYQIGDDDQRAVRRVPLALGSRPEDLAEDVVLYLPNRQPPFLSDRTSTLHLTE